MQAQDALLHESQLLQRPNGTGVAGVHACVGFKDRLTDTIPHAGSYRDARLDLSFVRTGVQEPYAERGQVFMPDWGPRPWGWEPDRVLPAVAPTGGC